MTSFTIGLFSFFRYTLNRPMLGVTFLSLSEFSLFKSEIPGDGGDNYIPPNFYLGMDNIIITHPMLTPERGIFMEITIIYYAPSYYKIARYIWLFYRPDISGYFIV